MNTFLNDFMLIRAAIFAAIFANKYRSHLFFVKKDIFCQKEAQALGKTNFYLVSHFVWCT